MSEFISPDEGIACDGCGNASFVDSGTFFVCSVCGLVLDTPKMAIPRAFKNEKIDKQVIHSSTAHPNVPRSWGSYIDLKKDAIFRKDQRAIRLSKTAKRNMPRINTCDSRNRALLDILLNETGIDAITADRCKDTFNKIILHDKLLVIESRKTTNSINLAFLGALVSVMSERVNLERSSDERIVNWITEQTIDAMNIDERTRKTIDEVVDRASTRECDPAGYLNIVQRIKALERSRLDWTERAKKNAMSKFNRYRLSLDNKIDFLRNNKKKIAFLLNQIGINQHVKKIMKLIEMTTEPGLIIDYLARACALIVYSYYNKHVTFTVTDRVKRYLDWIEKRCGFILVDEEMEMEATADIIRPKIIINNRNEYWNEIFNDEFDQIIDATHTFCEEIPRHDLDLIYSIASDRINDLDYVTYMLRGMGRAYVIDTFKLAPFVHVREAEKQIEYSSFMPDVDVKIREFLERGKLYARGTGRATFYVGKPRGNRRHRDMYSLNMIIKKRDGSGVYDQWLPVGEVKEIIEYIYEQDGTIIASEITKDFIALGYVFQSTNSEFKKSHRYKIYLTIQLLFENGFLVKDRNGYAINAKMNEALQFIDAIEIKH